MTQVNNSTPATAPDFSGNTESVNSQIMSELGHLNGLWSQLSALMADLAAAQADRPVPTAIDPDAKDDVRKAAEKKNADDLTAWADKVKGCEDAVRSCQQEIEQSQQKLANLQGTQLPQAQARDRSDMDRWMEDQKKAQEALANSATGSTFDKLVDGPENADAIRKELVKIKDKTAAVQIPPATASATSSFNASSFVNTQGRTGAIDTTIGRTAPRDDGLTID